MINKIKSAINEFAYNHTVLYWAICWIAGFGLGYGGAALIEKLVHKIRNH